jgi:glycyl-tRNA synthetase
LTPYLVAVIPLKKEFSSYAEELYRQLTVNPLFEVTYEQASSIGKSYRRQDAIGTYFCLTVDSESLTNDTVTLRQRDTMNQIKLPRQELVNYLNNFYSQQFSSFFANSTK